MKFAQFIAVILTALALVPSGAHLFELPNKIVLDESNYFIVQTIYRGWDLFGLVLIGAVLANLALAYEMRGQRAAMGLVLINLLCLIGTLMIFFAFTFTANQATSNWTQMPANWQTLRWQWEISHAANAVITFVGFCSLTISLLLARR